MVLDLRKFNVTLLLVLSLVLSGCATNKSSESMQKHSKIFSAMATKEINEAEMESLINGPDEELISALKSNPELVNIRIGKTLPAPPLFIALKKMNVIKVQALLEAGANPEAWSKDEEIRRKPLRWAVEKYAALRSGFPDKNSPGNEKKILRCIELLLKHGANPNSIDDPYDGYTLLHIAADGGKRVAEVVQLLIKYGADKKIRTEGAAGSTAYELAVIELAEMEQELSRKANKLEKLDTHHHEFIDLEYSISKKRGFITGQGKAMKLSKYHEFIDLEFSILKERGCISEQRRIIKLLES